MCSKLSLLSNLKRETNKYFGYVSLQYQIPLKSEKLLHNKYMDEINFIRMSSIIYELCKNI